MNDNTSREILETLKQIANALQKINATLEGRLH